jgi:hypothetical protein
LSIVNLKQDIDPNIYFDKINSIFNKIKENNQKISLLMLKPIGFTERIEIDHLCTENAKLKIILNRE